MREEILETLKESPTDQVDLGEMNIQDSELKEISQKIVLTRPEVQEVYFNQNKITDEGAATIAAAFENLNQLKLLDIQFNQLSETGLKSLLSLKKGNPELQFHFHGNKVYDVGVMKQLEEDVLGKKNKLGK